MPTTGQTITGRTGSAQPAGFDPPSADRIGLPPSAEPEPVNLRTGIEPEMIDGSERWRWVVIIDDDFRYGPWTTEVDAARGQHAEILAVLGHGIR